MSDSASGVSVNNALIAVQPRIFTSTVSGVAVVPRLIEVQPRAILVKPIGANVAPQGINVSPSSLLYAPSLPLNPTPSCLASFQQAASV